MTVDSAVINEWLELKQQIETLSSQERALRIKITEAVLAGKEEGSKTSTIDGIKLTATAVVNYNIDKEELDLIKDSLTDEELACLRYKPEVTLKNFRKLDPERTYQLFRAVSTSKGLPQLKVV